MSLPVRNFSTDKRFTLYSGHNDDDSVTWFSGCRFCGLLIKNDSEEITGKLMTEHVIGCLNIPDRVLSDMDKFKIERGIVADPLEEK